MDILEKTWEKQITCTVMDRGPLRKSDFLQFLETVFDRPRLVLR